MARAEQPGHIFERLKARASERPNWSTLLRWYLAHFDAFAAAIAEADGRPSWDAIADELTATGLTARGRRPITGNYARIVWWKARQIHARREATATAGGRSGAARGATPPSRVEREPQPKPPQETRTVPAPPAPASADDDDFPLVFMGGRKRRTEGS